MKRRGPRAQLIDEYRNLLLLLDGKKIGDWMEILPILHQMDENISPRSKFMLIRYNFLDDFLLDIDIDEEGILRVKDIAQSNDWVEESDFNKISRQIDIFLGIKKPSEVVRERFKKATGRYPEDTPYIKYLEEKLDENDFITDEQAQLELVEARKRFVKE